MTAQRGQRSIDRPTAGTRQRSQRPRRPRRPAQAPADLTLELRRRGRTFEPWPPPPATPTGCWPTGSRRCAAFEALPIETNPLYTHVRGPAERPARRRAAYPPATGGAGAGSGRAPTSRSPRARPRTPSSARIA